MTMTEKKRSFFDDLSPGWHENNIFNDRERTLLDEVLPGEELGRGGVVIDLGGGTGRFANYLIDIYPLRCLVLDISSGMLTEAGRYSAHPLLHRVQADAHHLPLDDASIRFVFSFCSFPHFDRKDDVLRECRRVLIPGGIIMILHACSREQINHFHAAQREVIAGDYLPPLECFRDWGRKLELIPEYLEDGQDCFLVRYRKPSA